MTITHSYNDKIVEQINDFWSTHDCSESDKNFYCFPPIRTRSCNLIFNTNDASQKDWCEYWTVQKYLQNIIPCEKILSICCGFGEVERTLSKLNVGKKIIGLDIASGAIEAAKKRSLDENLTNVEYHVADINKIILPQEEYDIIWANGALHHIRDLIHVIPMLYKSLKPGGYLISNEYVGPNYQQISTRHEELVNAVIQIIPSELKKETIILGNHITDTLNLINRFLGIRKRWDLKEKWEKPTKSYFLKNDPSECINSEMIIPIMKKIFDDVTVKYFNGSILMFALDHFFYDNFDKKSHQQLLDFLFLIEDTLVEIGEIPNINAHIICKKN